MHAHFDHVTRTTRERGIDGLRFGATRFLTDFATARALTTFLDVEGHTRFGLIPDSRGGVRPRPSAAWTHRELNDGLYRPLEDPQLPTDGMVTSANASSATAATSRPTRRRHRLPALLMRERAR